MDETAFTFRRWRRRFTLDDTAAAESGADGRAPDATSEEVGVPPDNIGFEGRPMKAMKGSGYGSGTPGGSGWAGWAGRG